MSINNTAKQLSTAKPRFLALVLVSASLITGLSAIATTAQAAGLGELFGNDNGTAKAKFLSVDQAFQMNNSVKATSKGTQLSIRFNITPGHYVYKDRLTLSFPKGVSASPFTFSQTPVSINDPTFGRVPVFSQKSIIATTTLSANNGKALNNAAVTIGWQGCAKAGLCYPPQKTNTTVNIAASR